MNTGLISTRYAKALYEMAKIKNTEQTVYLLAIDVVNILKNSDELKQAMQHPLLSSRQKKEIFLSKLKDSNALFKSFIDIVFENKREELMVNIFLKYIEYYRKMKNIFAGKLITAHGIDATTARKLAAVIERDIQGTLEMEYFIQPAIIGGFILEVDNLRWDASVSGQLRTIRNNFAEQNKKTI